MENLYPDLHVKITVLSEAMNLATEFCTMGGEMHAVTVITKTV